MAGAYAWAGLWGLLLLRVLLIAAVAVTLWHALRATKGPVESSLWAATVVVAASARCGVRPELFSLLFLTMTASLTLVLLRGRCTGRSFGVGVLVLFSARGRLDPRSFRLSAGSRLGGPVRDGSLDGSARWRGRQTGHRSRRRRRCGCGHPCRTADPDGGVREAHWRGSRLA